MASIFKHLIAFLGVYLLAWTISYLAIFLTRGDGLDLSHYFEYLGLAWTFRGGELPAFIWLFSIVGFVPLAGLVIWALARHSRNTASPDHSLE